MIGHSLPESTSTEAKNEDTQTVTSLISKYVGVNAHISNVTQIGKQIERPRLMKVMLSTKEKIKILCNRLNLLKKEQNSYIKWTRV